MLTRSPIQPIKPRQTFHFYPLQLKKKEQWPPFPLAFCTTLRISAHCELLIKTSQPFKKDSSMVTGHGGKLCPPCRPFCPHDNTTHPTSVTSYLPCLAQWLIGHSSHRTAPTGFPLPRESRCLGSLSTLRVCYSLSLQDLQPLAKNS